MLLRKLEVYGFKSFADRCEIEFGPGVTSIVGPNGSGKSNVSDAIRWALGEQSIRNLRGTKTEDVIFAGSSKRRPLGAAEVSLVFDNTDGLLPLEFSEVTITRRAFRTGESEYYINKTQCRLKDIHDLLSDTGLGRDSLTVIGQNKIDELLNAKPEDRRLMFEEAAGVTKYKYRKREALRKLDETELNLTRVRDLTGEIEAQLGPLAENAARTTEYNELYGELVSCQVTLLLSKLEHAEKMVESAKLEEQALAEAELAASSRLSIVETEREKQTEELARLDQAVNEAALAINQFTTELERIEGRIALLSEKLAQGQRDVDRLTSEQSLLAHEQEQSAVQMQQLVLSKAEKEIGLKDAETTLQALLAQDQQLSEAIRQTETDIQSSNENSFDHIQELVNERNNLRIAERDLETQKNRQASLTKENDKYLAEIEEVNKQLAAAAAEQEQTRQQMLDIAAETQRMSDGRAALQRELAKLTDQEKAIASQLETLSSRRQVLAAMEEDNEGYSRGTKSVLKTSQPWQKRICGAVGQLISVEDRFLTAIEIALGGSLQHVVTTDDETAKAAVAYLKAQKLGRTTFLPLSTLRPQKARDSELAAAKAAGAIGLASTLVKCEPQYKPVIDYLLGRTVVVSDVDSALRIARQFNQSVKLVTLDGELISPGGSITGGSLARREASILGRQNEIAALAAEMANKQKEKRNLEQLINTQTSVGNELQIQLDELASRRYTIDLKQNELTLRSEKLNNDTSRLDFSLKTILSELSDIQDGENQIRQRMLQAQKSIAELEKQDVHDKQNHDILQERLKNSKLQKDRLSMTLTDAHICLSSMKQELRNLDGEIGKITAEQALKASHYTRITQELTTIAETEKRLREQSEVEGRTKESTFLAKQNLEQTRQALLDKKLMVMADMQKTDKETRDLRRKVQNMQAKLHEMQLLSAKYDYEITFSQEQLKDRYEITRERANDLRRTDEPEALHRRIYELESRINRLGPVNPAAIEEYNRLNERFTFLQTQMMDLLSAKEYLTSIVADIDNTMSKQFTSAFIIINEYFQETFVKLFGGGQASLHLLEPDNVLESGIEIFVQPPGKKQQNLALLSGGERALTVIALLFAFLTYRPTPFVVVDEIDAALDEANVQRFSEFLAEFARNTQFIVVTHRKGTMEAADVMIGVTMEESGISRLLSVKLMDKAG